MWTAPVAQELFEVGSDRLHPYVRPFGAASLTAGQDGFRDASSNQPHDLASANGSHGLSRTLDRSILPSTPLAAPARPVRRAYRSADLLGGERRCTKHPRGVVILSCRHKLPGDTGNLVGNIHVSEFWRLALQTGPQPRW